MRTDYRISPRRKSVELVDLSSGKHYLRPSRRRPRRHPAGARHKRLHTLPVPTSSAWLSPIVMGLGMFLGGLTGLLVLMTWREEYFVPVLLGVAFAAVAFAGACKLSAENAATAGSSPHPVAS